MSVTKEDVKKVARLARIRVSDAEVEAYTPQLDKIIGFVEQLSEVDTDNIEPLANVVDSELYLRPDAVTDGDCQDKVLSNAPETASGFFVVPKVVE
ncbi:Asp-tRNA(Asn)/Glu-tRNA(Gln) amidotransferase subunit GatC [Alphaproteobacteria bacterium]|nr:Asp-tRNA(Asn)/Glu-tRNA(Gln) amidotransferase subunit GatC [Alphaproteobacteria bacterium]